MPNGAGRGYGPIGKGQSGGKDKDEYGPQHCNYAGCAIKQISNTSCHFALSAETPLDLTGRAKSLARPQPC